MDEQSLHTLLDRARQIQEEGLDSDPGNDRRLIYDAAELAGISREAIDRAIQERVAFRSPTQTAGDLIWALAPDGDHHLAEFVASDGENTTVRYENQTLATLPESATEAFSAVPGHFLDFEERPGRWVRGEIREIRPDKRWVFVRLPNNDVRYVAYRDARLRAQAPSPLPPAPRWHLPVIGYLASAALGALLMWFFMR